MPETSFFLPLALFPDKSLQQVPLQSACRFANSNFLEKLRSFFCNDSAFNLSQSMFCGVVFDFAVCFASVRICILARCLKRDDAPLFCAVCFTLLQVLMALLISIAARRPSASAAERLSCVKTANSNPSSASLSEQEAGNFSGIQQLVSDSFKLFMIHCVPFFFKLSHSTFRCLHFFRFWRNQLVVKRLLLFSKAEVSILCPRGYAIDSPKTLQCTGRPP